jgi:hypothetical protein
MQPLQARLAWHLLVSLAGGASAYGQSVWPPGKGEFTVSPGFTYSTFNEFWAAHEKVGSLKDNNERLDQYTGFVKLEYGILSSLAADLTIGYTTTSSTKTFANDSDDGLADTEFGLRYRFVTETRTRPAVAVRVGGIIAGTYDEKTPFAGDGANGFETSVLLGKTFGETGFGLYADMGYRVREADVPEDVFGSFGAIKQFYGIFHDADMITLSFDYHHVQATSGLNIGGAGFDPTRASHGFPALREVNQLVEGSIGYADAGHRHYQFAIAKSVDGRNTGDKLVFLFTVIMPFGRK